MKKMLKNYDGVYEKDPLPPIWKMIAFAIGIFLFFILMAC